MAFYDIDLEKKIESNHELRKINECIDFSSVAYRVNSGKSEVGRHGYGLDCGVFVFAIYGRSFGSRNGKAAKVYHGLSVVLWV